MKEDRLTPKIKSKIENLFEQGRNEEAFKLILYVITDPDEDIVSIISIRNICMMVEKLKQKHKDLSESLANYIIINSIEDAEKETEISLSRKYKRYLRKAMENNVSRLWERL